MFVSLAKQTKRIVLGVLMGASCVLAGDRMTANCLNV